MPAPLILASSSRYRAELLSRLVPDFKQLSPTVDESRQDREAGMQMAVRLATDKAHAVQRLQPGAIVIGSDQVACLNGQTLGKPGSLDAARKQLMRCSGQSVQFHTAVCVLDADGSAQLGVDLTTVRFRQLEADEIDRYLVREPATDCCGGFKVEGLGISLFREVATKDPTALIGLPLIRTAELLRSAGLRLP